MDPEQVITMKEMFEINDTAVALMGSASSSVCSYSQGYIKRQPIFTCLTCTPAANETKAGICLACSLNCHDKHNVLELYTKRDFCCDCGTLPQVFCNIDTNEKHDRNALNKYNKNFSGSYCTCHRPYPDDAPDAEQTEMIQCSCCEDWYHTSHLNHAKYQSGENKSYEAPLDYDEMICHCCIGEHPFLAAYALPLSENVKLVGRESEENKSVDVEEVSSTKEEKVEDMPNTKEDIITEESQATEGSQAIEDPNANHTTPPAEDEPETKRQRVHPPDCFHNTIPFSDRPISTCYYNLSYREKLCKCSDCIALFEEHQISFLRNAEDSLITYEEMNLEKAKSEEESFASTIESLPHAQKCEVARCIGNIKTAITSIFEGKSKDDVLTPDDVKAAFAKLRENPTQ